MTANDTPVAAPGARCRSLVIGGRRVDGRTKEAMRYKATLDARGRPKAGRNYAAETATYRAWLSTPKGASPSEGKALVKLNGDWQITEDEIQWVLQQRRAGAKASKSQWSSDSFYRRRDPLLMFIAERCGPVDPAAVGCIASWPNIKPGGTWTGERYLPSRVSVPSEEAEGDQRPLAPALTTADPKALGVWFNKNVSHRHTGARTPWMAKPLRLKVAIILAANRHGTDAWELLKPKYQEQYLGQADSHLEASCEGRPNHAVKLVRGL